MVKQSRAAPFLLMPPLLKHEIEQYESLPDARRHRELLKFWHDYTSEWSHVALSPRLFARVDGISCPAERNFSACLGSSLDSLRTTTAADEVEQIMLLRLNKRIIPAIRA